ncbi:methyl-accepting chemotaxis protein [Salibacterium aidingense]|uniref:methyl-accepting chemotaxis protein n=1 Tax=Salibacterium aidingense TaxID=384933 RepID=UPI000426A6CE|nr:HAMP domain-containing methyl-accepting chemotaxis protein [Salibacterium aidingense]
MKGKRKKYSFSIRKKLVLGISVLSIVTYGTSAFFIFVLGDMLPEALGISNDLFIVTTLVLGWLWSGILAFASAPLITRPLKRLETSARKAAAGHLEDDVQVIKSDDEFRALGLAYNDMLENLRTMVNDIENNFTETNKQVLEITKASEEASAQAETITGTVHDIASGAENSANAIQNTAESMEEVTDLAGQVQAKARNSQESAAQMVTTLDENKQVIHSLVEGIKQLEEDNKESRSAVKSLDQQAQKIGEIIGLVGDISDQTNLLALNASIEAARAGEYGKGFAVVADEVRKLADESAKAVQDVRGLIQSIQSEVGNVVGKIENQMEVASRESQKGSETNSAFEQMESSVQTVASSVEQITGLIDRQMEAIEQTSRESQEVAAIAEQTSAGAMEVTSAADTQSEIIKNSAGTAEYLSRESEKLKKTIDKFTTSA